MQISSLLVVFVIIGLFAGYDIATAITVGLDQERVGANARTAANSYPYVAIITCSVPGAQRVGWQACLGKLETRIDGRSSYNEAYSLAGRPWDKGGSIEFPLTESFEVKAQNNGRKLALEVEILDLSGRSVFQKQAGYMGWIVVGN